VWADLLVVEEEVPLATLSPEERKALASKAAKARWAKAKKKNKKR
jgi:hypothetical protein